MPSTSDYLTQLQTDKTNLVSNLNTMGVEASNSETFTSLAPKVLNIEATPSLQNKSVTITENTTTNITADSGYDGLETVSVTTNVSGGTTPNIGFVINEWDSNGYATKVTVYGMTRIPAGAFSVNSSNTYNKSLLGSYLQSINLPSGITSINDYAFNSCTNLALTSLPNGITNIGNYAFSSCTNLALTSLPSALTNIGNYAFAGCTNLVLTSLPSGITAIGNNAFNNCINLALTSLPDGITRIGVSTFYGCTNLALTSLPSRTTYIDTYAFYGCTNLALTSLPSGVTTIGQSAFRDCANLVLTSLPSTLTWIYGTAFQNCTKLKQLSMSGIQTITGNSSGNGAFYGCTNLKQVWIGSSAGTIGRYTFRDCSALEKIYINLPRTTVEAMAGYNYAFMDNTSKTGIIVCNDDEGFITQEEFDAIDWSEQ